MGASVSSRTRPVRASVSSIHGKGLFARKQYIRGDLVGEYRGRIISLAEVNTTSSAADPDPAYTLLFSLSGDLFIDAGIKGNSIRFMNHSCAPNCRSVLEGTRIFLYARRRIAVGEELTYDYSLQPLDASDTADMYPCNCGSSKCRGSLLDRAVRRRMAGLRLQSPT